MSSFEYDSLIWEVVVEEGPRHSGGASFYMITSLGRWALA